MANSKNPNKKTNTEAAVRELITPIADRLGYALWDVRFVKEGTEHYLRITIDKADGIQIDDCEKMSRAVDPVLDEADPISCSYYLEVSSPGLGRALTRPEHFEAMTGKQVRVHLIRPYEDERDFTGVLTSYDGSVTISTDDGQTLTFEKNNISSVKLNDDVGLF
jgi:ribosome maturation factor RimP